MTITAEDLHERACVFCEIVAGEAPAAIVREWPDAIAFVPLNPVIDGHVLVIPRYHVADATTQPDVTADTMRRAAELARESEHSNILTSVGAPATQSIFHLHIHVIPRAFGDQLMVPWGTTGNPHDPHRCKGMDSRDEELEQLRAELSCARDRVRIESGIHAGGQVSCEDVTMLLRKAETERDQTRETLGESDLEALTLAQWEAIADADRDRLEAERDALKAANERGREVAQGWLDDLKPHEQEQWAVAARHVCGLVIQALAVPESHEGERADGNSKEILSTSDASRTGEVIALAGRIMTGSSRDWSLHADDAWLYALLVGWDCEMPEHADGAHDEIDCSGPDHLEDFAGRFGWTEGGIAKLRAQRKVIRALANPERPLR